MQPTGCMDIEPEPSHGVPCQSLIQNTNESDSTTLRAARLDGGSFFCHWGCKPCLYTSRYCSFGQGTSNKILDQHVPVVLSQWAVIPHPSYARLANSTSIYLQLPHPITKGYSRLHLLLLFWGCCCTTTNDDRGGGGGVDPIPCVSMHRISDPRSGPAQLLPPHIKQRSHPHGVRPQIPDR